MAPHSQPPVSENIDSSVTAENTTSPAKESTAARGIGFPKAPTFQDKYEERQYQKKRLALAFRIFAKLGFDEGVAGHITLRVRMISEVLVLLNLLVSFNLCSFHFIFKEHCT
jgi:hypothetical protein